MPLPPDSPESLPEKPQKFEGNNIPWDLMVKHCEQLLTKVSRRVHSGISAPSLEQTLRRSRVMEPVDKLILAELRKIGVIIYTYGDLSAASNLCMANPEVGRVASLLRMAYNMHHSGRIMPLLKGNVSARLVDNFSDAIAAQVSVLSLLRGKKRYDLRELKKLHEVTMGTAIDLLKEEVKEEKEGG